MRDNRLEALARVVDCEHKTAPEAEEGQHYAFSVGTPALRGSGIDFALAKPVDQETYAAWSRRAELRAGDVILAREAPVGGVGFVDGQTRVCLGQRTVLIRADQNQLDPRFLYYSLQAPAQRTWMSARSEGSTVPHLNVGDIRDLPLAFLPPVEEQRRIAAVLGAFDDLIDTNQRLMTRFDQLGMVMFLQAWDGTAVTTVESLGAVTMGQSPPSSTYNEVGDGPVFFQGVRDFGDRYPSSRVFCSAPTRLADSGDILIAVRAPVGETNVAVTETAIGRGLAALRANQPAIALRALRALDSTWAPHQGTGTVFAAINGNDLRAAIVPLVADSELERDLQALDTQHRACAIESEHLRAARDELLPLLISGAVSPGEVDVGAA